MTGRNPKWPFCNNNKDPSDPRHFTRCVENIAAVISENEPLDFIALQETSNSKLLLKELDGLKSMKFKMHTSSNMVTFWNPEKYTLISGLHGRFDPGRPWTALFFTNNLCFINVHAGHYNFVTLTQKLLRAMYLIEAYVAKNKILDPDFRVIMAGDFNCIINKQYNKIVLSTKKLHLNETRINTFVRARPGRGIHFDHIMDTKQAPAKIYVPQVAKPASDHLPIIGILAA
jgi:endonuclease/exonuclease/phosphatase family metal-dependent hydrolase